MPHKMADKNGQGMELRFISVVYSLRQSVDAYGSLDINDKP